MLKGKRVWGLTFPRQVAYFILFRLYNNPTGWPFGSCQFTDKGTGLESPTFNQKSFSPPYYARAQSLEPLR